MSVPVALDALRAALAERGGTAYLLTVSEDARPHAVHVAIRWEDDLICAEVGKRTGANLAERPSVSLLCPARSDNDYSLIVDGTAALDSAATGRALITPTKAILHRPAAAPDPASACAADCVPLGVSAPGRKG